MTAANVIAERFSSLSSLALAHSELKKEFAPGVNPGPELLQAAERFVRRGQATGAVLASHDEQVSAQTLLDYWATLLSRYHRDIDSTLDEYDPELAPVLDDADCPYRGLEIFNERDSEHFFGRERLISQLRDRLATDRFLAVTGPSGSGKSSVVLAGIIPALLKTHRWKRYVRAVPGADPILSLVRALGPLQADVGSAWVEQRANWLREEPQRLSELADRYGEPLIVVIDQFEEAFTICNDGAARTAFETALDALISARGPDHRVIITLRSDFEGAMARMPRLWAHYDTGKVQLMPLGPAELREAIERPAKEVGLTFEDGLVDQLYSDVVGEAAALPLLQVILLKLWQRRKRNLVSWEEYKQLGGGRLALGNSADEYYTGLLPENQRRVKRILLALVRPVAGEGASSRLRREMLWRALGQPGWLDDSLEDLRRAGLIRITNGDRPEDDEIEIAHEALVRNWPRLADWLTQDRAVMTFGRALEQRIAEWLRLGAGAAGLLDEESLAEVLRWKQDPEAVLLSNTDHFQKFIAASQAAVDEAKNEKESARQLELELREQVAMEQARRAAHLRRNVMILAFLLCVALVTMAFAFYQKSRATDEAREAGAQRAKAMEQTAIATKLQQEAQGQSDLADEQSRLAAHNEKLAKAAQTTAEKQLKYAELQKEIAVKTTAFAEEKEAEAKRLLLQTKQQADQLQDLTGQLKKEKAKAESKARLFDSGELSGLAKSSLPNAEAALLYSLQAVRILDANPTDVAKTWKSARDARATLRQAVRESRTAVLENLGKPARGLSFSPDGSRVVLAANQAIEVRDAFSGRLIGNPVPLAGSYPTSVAFSPDGRWIAAGAADKQVVLLRADPISVAATLATKAAQVSKIAFSPNGSRLAAAGGSQLYLWEVDSQGQGGPPLVFEAPAAIQAIAFDRTATWLAAGFGAQVALFDLATSLPSRSQGQPAPLTPILNKDLALPAQMTDLLFVGNQVWFATDDGQTRIAESVRFMDDSPDQLAIGPSIPARPVSLSTNIRATRVAVAGADGLVRVYNLGPLRLAQSLAGHDGPIVDTAFSPDGSRLASIAQDGTMRVHNLNGRDSVLGQLAATGMAPALALSPDGHRFAYAPAGDAPIKIVDVASGKETALPAPSYKPSAAAIGAGGRIAVGGAAGQVSIFEGAGDSSARTLTLHRAAVQRLFFSPDGTKLVSLSQDGEAALLNMLSMETAARFKSVYSVAWRPDNRRLAIAMRDQTVKVFDGGSDASLKTITGRYAKYAVAFSPDNKILAVGGDDRQVHLYDASSFDEIEKAPKDTGRAYSVRFSPDGNRMLTAGDRGVRIWDTTDWQPLDMVWPETAYDAAFVGQSQILGISVDRVFRLWPADSASLVRSALYGLVRPWRDGECEAALDDDTKECAAFRHSAPYLVSAVASARAGDRERAVGQLSQARIADSWLANIVDPERDAREIERVVWLERDRARAASDLAQAEALAAAGMLPEAGALFGKALDQPPNSAVVQQRITAITESAAVPLLAVGRRLAVERKYRDLAIVYLQKARQFDRRLSFDPTEEADLRYSMQQIRATEFDRNASRFKMTAKEALEVFNTIARDNPQLLTSDVWNKLCREHTAALLRTGQESSAAASQIAPACEEAPRRSPGNGFYRDSRGLNRMLRGDRPGAIADFKAYIAWTKDASIKERRERWIKQLQKGPMVLSSQELAELEREAVPQSSRSIPQATQTASPVTAPIRAIGRVLK